MAVIDLWAIVWGLVAGVVLSGVAGAILGGGIISDMLREKGQSDSLDNSDDTELGPAMEKALSQPAALTQILVLSIGASAVSGALTARLVDTGPLTNAAIVGVIGTLVSLPFLRNGSGMPRRLVVLSILTTLPATLLGAWLVG